MIKKTTNLLKTVTVAFCAFMAVSITSCQKSPNHSSIVFQNNTYTPISISVNGTQQVIPVGSSVTYVSDAGSTANVIASTSGTTTAGTIVGETYTWNFTDNFPGGGSTVTDDLNVDASYFFLYMVNNTGYPTNTVIVNYGSPTVQTTDNVTVPSDGNPYALGYYLGYSNTYVGAQLSNGGGTVVTASPLNIPYVTNAHATAYIP